MYYNKFIDFLKKYNIYDEEIVNSFFNNATMFDYLEEEYRCFIGSFYIKQCGILKKISVIVPFIDSDKTVLINIHEYVHFYLMYKKLHKKVKIGNDIEILPILFEKLYIMESNNEELVNYGKYLDSKITDNDYKYKLALEIRDDLIEIVSNRDDINKLNRRVKLLCLKKKINNCINL